MLTDVTVNYSAVYRDLKLIEISEMVEKVQSTTAMGAMYVVPIVRKCPCFLEKRMK